MEFDALFQATGLAVGGLVCFGVAGLLGILRPSSRFGVSGLLCFIGGVLSLLAAIVGPSGSAILPEPFGLAGIEIAFRVDSLSRWLLALIGTVGISVCAYLPGYLDHLRGKARPGLVWSGLGFLFGSMAGVVLSANAIVFFAFWELMALSSFLLVATEHERQSVRRAAFIYLGATRIGSGFLMAGFLWAHAITGSWEFQDWVLHGGASTGPATLILIGMLTKAGSWPFHLWLPIAHPAAPSPVSAVMSGVMIKTAIYGILRLFVMGGFDVSWMGWTLVASGAISAFWGVMFALLQRDLKRMLAYSSVENIGLILLAIGFSLVARNIGLHLVADLALGAALFHILGHGIFKSLLFLCAGSVDAAAHTREMDRLGGLLHKMPWTGGAFFIGSAAICALPPLSGFASEWMLVNGLFKLSATGPTGEIRLAGLLMLGWIGLTSALAMACFVKAFGISFLGRPRTVEAGRAREADAGMVAASVFLAVLCAALGLAAPWVWQVMFRMGFVRFEHAWTLPLIPVTVGIVVTSLLIWLGVRALKARAPVRAFDTWDCGFGPLPARAQYSATSLTQPIARLFGAMYRYEMEVVVEGKKRRHFPTEVRVQTSHEVYLESKVYSPALSGILRLSEGFIMRLQAGSIHQYLFFMVVTLGLLLWLGGVL